MNRLLKEVNKYDVRYTNTILQTNNIEKNKKSLILLYISRKYTT